MQELSRKKGRGHKCWFLEWQTFCIVPLSLVWKDGRLKDRITSPSSRCVVVVSSWVFIEKEIDNAFYLLDKKTLREAGRDFDVAPPQRLCITKNLWTSKWGGPCDHRISVSNQLELLATFQVFKKFDSKCSPLHGTYWISYTN